MKHLHSSISPHLPSHLPTLGDHHRQLGSVVLPGGHVLNPPQGQQAVQQLSKDHVFPVQEVALGTGDEELAAVAVGTTVGLDFTTLQGMRPRGFCVTHEKCK